MKTRVKFPVSFYSRINKSGPVSTYDGNPCWVWTGPIVHNGYGQCTGTGLGTNRAHRISWILNVGPIPIDMLVLHHCDNPPCVNPHHLFLGTQQDNVDDCVGKDRNAKGERISIGKLLGSDVKKIRRLYATGKYTYEKLGKRFHVTKQTIYAVIKREVWRHVV